MLCAMCTKNNRYAHRNAKKKACILSKKKAIKTLELKLCSALVLLNISLFKRNVFELVAQKMPYFIPL